MKVVAVMPAYNEGSRIAAAIHGALPFVHAIVVVDDGSRDNTYAEAKSAGAIALRHKINRGQGAALKTGNVAALKLGADIIVHIDADGQHDPAYINTLIAPIQNKEADVVYGSRYMSAKSEGMPLARKILHVGIRQFNAWALGIPRGLTDPQSGLRALSAEAAKEIHFHQDRMAHCSELLKAVTRSRFKYMEVPARVIYTQDSLAKGQEGKNAVTASLRIVWQLFIGSFR